VFPIPVEKDVVPVRGYQVIERDVNMLFQFLAVLTPLCPAYSFLTADCT